MEPTPNANKLAKAENKIANMMDRKAIRRQIALKSPNIEGYNKWPLLRCTANA